MVIRHCSPTLAGLKTGSLFSCRYETEEALREDVRAMNRLLVPKGLRVLSLRYREGLALIYLYRPDRLDRDLTAPAAARLLEERGYPCGNADLCVVKLLHQLRERREFPHEIGLFLGYPLEDVKGFIQNKGQGYACCGLWKSYGDPRAARRYFDRCRACTAAYKRRYAAGVPLERLIVAA